MIELEAIAFNHDPATATHDALNLRRNATEWIAVPEWRRARSVTPEDSPAAYALARVAGQAVTIQASFSCDDPSITIAEVRARDNVIDPGPSGCTGQVIDLFRRWLQQLYGNVLGEVQARTVAFVNGQSGLLPFFLTRTKLAQAGVGSHTTEWRWEYRLPNQRQW